MPRDRGPGRLTAATATRSPATLRMAVVVSLLAGGLPEAHAQLWSWPEASQYAPPDALFTARGTATVEFGAQYAAPGAPPDKQHLYGVIRYRDNLDSHRHYDLFFQPTLAIWKIWRYESFPDGYAQYVGGHNYDNCQDGFFTATDRVFMPALGTYNAIEAGQPGSEAITSIRTNFGCRNNHYSLPFPIDNYQGAGSGSGVIPDLAVEPTWDAQSQTLFSASYSVPWVYYEGVLDPDDPRFLGDFGSYDAPTRAFIQDRIAAALHNVRLESQIRILPDGTIMWTHLWTDLKGRPWTAYATDGHWLAADSWINGRLFYYDPALGAYVDPFAGGQNPNGMFLNSGNGWVGLFIDPLRPDFGLGIYYHKPGGISVNPPHYSWGPAVVATNYFTTIPPLGSVFRQMFFTIGTREEMQAKSAILNDYVFVFTVDDGVERLCANGMDDDGDGLSDCADADCAGSPFCEDLTCIRPTSAQDASIIAGAVDATSPFGLWGKHDGQGVVQVGIHDLPAGLSPAQVALAVLRIPRTDNGWTADDSALDLRMRIRHILPAQPSAVALADATSPPLAEIGIYREPGPYIADNRRRLLLDVTNRVRADLAAGRSAFAWRIEPQSVPDHVSSQRYFPTVDNTDPAFGDLHGAELCLLIEDAPPPNPDGDFDGDVDSADLNLFRACMSGPNASRDDDCGGFDFDDDQDVDQADFGVLQRCLSGPRIPFDPACIQ